MCLPYNAPNFSILQMQTKTSAQQKVSFGCTNLALSKDGDGISNVHNNLNVCCADEDKKGNDKYAHMYADSIEL